jgi:radical SAM protein with 4Fe4S-binding SPASM domain
MLYNTLSAPITCQIELTSACNNSCLYCYNHWRHGSDTTQTSIDPAMLDRIAEQVIDGRIFQVIFTGGECMLEKKQLFKGLEMLITHGVSCTVNSNLTTMTEEDAQTLRKIGVRGILTSVCSHNPAVHDHINQRRGALDETIRGIKLSLASGISVAVSMVLIKQNVKDVIPTGLMLKSLGVRQIFATKASPPLNAVDFSKLMITREEMIASMDDLCVLQREHGMTVGILECYSLCSYGTPEKYPFVAERRCSAGITTCTIGSDGNIRPCSHSDKTYGNVMSTGLVPAWNAMTEQRDGQLLPAVCKACPLFADCSGGCRVDAFCCSGRYSALDPYARPKTVSKIVSVDRLVKPVSLSQKLEVNTGLHTRIESIGVLCADESLMGTPAILTRDTFDLVTALQGNQFTVGEVSTRFDIPISDAITLCSALVRDRVLMAVPLH